MRDAAIDPELASARRVAEAHGRHGAIGLGAIHLGPSALDGLAEIVAALKRSEGIVILEDATPMQRSGKPLKPMVEALLAPAGRVHRVVLGPENGTLHADSGAIHAAAEAARGAGCLVSVGSGTVTDIGKEAARATGVPLVAVQTAASVNGFADGMAVILRDGVKRTITSSWPAALVIDTKILAAAPPAMTSAGYGEMMSMFTAPADWRLAALTGTDESFDPAVVDLFRPRGKALLAAAPALQKGDEAAITLLARLLTSSGLAMGAAGRTAPLSGMEHLISHLLDMSAEADGRRVGLHGAQVGVAALVAACLWERLLDRLAPSAIGQPVRSDERMRGEIEDRFRPFDPTGKMAAECWSDYRQKLTAWRNSADRRSDLADRWTEHKTELATLVGKPADIAAALAAAGAPRRFAELDPPVSAERARWAVASCQLMRNRFTIADLAFFSGSWTEDDVAAVLRRATALGGGP
jgi:glycerol-1-phosphate dehydrogenase [NAD(P)+]